MVGLIQQNAARPKGRELNLKQIQKQINVPAEFAEAYKRVVIAGMKVMFDKSTHPMMLDSLKGQGSLGQKMGMGIAGLVLLLFQKSNKTLPPQVLVPAGVELLMQATYFLRKSKLAMPNNADIGEATQVMVTTLLEKFGVTADKLNAAIDQVAQKGAKQ